MRIARLQTDTGPRAGVVIEDTVRPLGADIGVLDLLGAAPARARAPRRACRGGRCAGRRAAARADRAADDPRLLGLRAAHRGRRRRRRSRGRGAGASGTSRRSATSRTRTRSPARATTSRCRPGRERLDLELEVAAIIGRAGRNLTPEEAGAHIAGYTIFNDWSARDLADRRDAARPRLLQGQGLRQHARPVDRHARRARAASATATASTSTLRAERQRRRARRRHARQHGLELRGAGRVRLARHVGAPGRRARLRHLRWRLPARAVGPSRPRGRRRWRPATS